MSSLEIQVKGLKRRVKELEQEITERTRNYLLQVSGMRLGGSRVVSRKGSEESGGERWEGNDEIVMKLREEVEREKKEKERLREELEEVKGMWERERNEKKMVDFMEQKQNNPNDKILPQTSDAHTNTQQPPQTPTQLLHSLQSTLQTDYTNLLLQKDQQLKDLKDELKNTLHTHKQQTSKLEEALNELRIVHESLVEETKIRVKSAELLREEKEMVEEKYEVLKGEKEVVEEKLRLSEECRVLVKSKHEEDMVKIGRYLGEIEQLKTQLLSFEHPLTLTQVSSYSQTSPSPLPQKHSIQTNTDPFPSPQSTSSKSIPHIHFAPQTHHSSHHIRHKNQYKKSQTIQSSKHLPIDQQIIKQNDILNEQLARKEEECRRMLSKVDEVEKENNKLIGANESYKRDMENQKEAQRILGDSLNELRSVVESQRGTIERLERQYEGVLAELDIKQDELNQYQQQKLPLLSGPASQPNTPQPSLVNPFTQSQIKQPSSYPQQDHGSKTPISRLANLPDDSQFNSSPIKQHPPSLLQDSYISSNTLTRKQSHRKYQKKISSKTYEMRQDPSDFCTSSVKSSRVFTCDDLKINIKGLLDNSVLLGKGVESIELIRGMVKQIESYTGVVYGDILADLERKRDQEKSAVNTGLMKEITELTKVRTECQQRIEGIKEEYQEIIKRKKESIRELKEKKEKLEWSNEELKERVEYLEDEMEKCVKKIGYLEKEGCKKNQLVEYKKEGERLREVERFLRERIEGYERRVEESEGWKGRLLKENEKKTDELNNVRSRLKSLEKQVKQLESSKSNLIKVTKKESEQIIEILLTSQLQQEKINQFLVEQLKQKQEALGEMAEEISFLNHEIRERERHLIEVGSHIKQIREAHNKLQSQNNSNALNQQNNEHIPPSEDRQVGMKEQNHLQQELAAKQELLLRAEKEVARSKVEVGSLNKQMEADRERMKVLMRNNKQMGDEIEVLNGRVEGLKKEVSFLRKEGEYESGRIGKEFQEMMEILFCARAIQGKEEIQQQNANKQQKKSDILTKTLNNSILSPDPSLPQTTLQQYQQIKSMFQTLNLLIYQVYSQLPHTSQNTSLFQAQTKEELFSQLKDIKRFAQAYRRLKESVKERVEEVEGVYKKVVRGIMGKVNGADEEFLSEVLDEVGFEREVVDKLKGEIWEMVPVAEVVEEKNIEQEKNDEREKERQKAQENGKEVKKNTRRTSLQSSLPS